MAYDYDVIIIGGGAAGLTSAELSASFRAKTAMVEKGRLGGDCTWNSCVPSKALLKSAKVASQMKAAFKYGLATLQPEFNFEKVMERVHSIQLSVYKDSDSPAIYEEMGVKVIQGSASFIDKNTIEIIDDRNNSTKLTSRYFVIATGSRPAIPNIQGIDKIDFLTNESIFNLEELPQKLVIIGAGPVGIEMAQAFARFGSKVIVIDISKYILPRDDKDFTPILRDILIREGVEFKLGYSIEWVEKSAGDILLHLHDKISGNREVLETENVFLATGRHANYEYLNLDGIGVDIHLNGIKINKNCRTTVQNIYACGDVTGAAQFTHYAEHMAKVAVAKMLLKIPGKLETNNLTWCTYTDPEIAHVGLTHEQLVDKKIKFETYNLPFSKIDRAVAESENDGLIKIFASKKSGKIFGATILGAQAGEMICEFALAIKNNISLRNIANTIHPYPTYGIGNRKAAEQWYTNRQLSGIIKLLQKFFKYRGELPDPPDREK